jgi:hypothetical protein
VPASIGPLAAGVGADVQVLVHIPSGAIGGATDTAIVSVRSQGNMTELDTSMLTTTVAYVSVSYLPLVLK